MHSLVALKNALTPMHILMKTLFVSMVDDNELQETDEVELFLQPSVEHDFTSTEVMNCGHFQFNCKQKSHLNNAKNIPAEINYGEETLAKIQKLNLRKRKVNMFMRK